MNDSNAGLGLCALLGAGSVLIGAQMYDMYKNHVLKWSDEEFHKVRECMEAMRKEYSAHIKDNEKSAEYLKNAKFVLEKAAARAETSGFMIPGSYRKGIVRDFWAPAYDYLSRLGLKDDPELTYRGISSMFNILWGKEGEALLVLKEKSSAELGEIADEIGMYNPLFMRKLTQESRKQYRRDRQERLRKILKSSQENGFLREGSREYHITGTGRDIIGIAFPEQATGLK